ncbi:hypothetical protein [Pseudoteredinibacter isoporae]|uniref:Uncharacterized protein n=1 Tax=Pseudoteredinibacter isoporae TaxID=570281 RepID=A0A7X0JTA0_9GAMM|nr:hypothetical protein [Pseudoteredinibacter isoporae]MBB6521878.1 hypothetical protein [Pseudoteredinibacter isoporae]NHO87422.1 hypothetical protein [Pseudoteredinibacter isoporae]NIB24247.1 hypothetical protein [Pseudoteredinibacter isoporae]
MSETEELQLYETCLLDAYVKTNLTTLNRAERCDLYRRVDRIECLSGAPNLGDQLIYRYQVGFGLRCVLSDEEDGGDMNEVKSGGRSEMHDPGLRLLASFQLDYLSNTTISDKALRAFAKKQVLSSAAVLWKDWVELLSLRLPLRGELHRELVRATGVNVLTTRDRKAF